MTLTYRDEIVEKIWVNSYQEGVRGSIDPECYSSLVELFEQSAQKFSSRSAFSNMGVKLTYQDLDRFSRCFAGYLQRSLSFNKGDRMAIMLPNLLQYPVAMFGIHRAGGVVVNVNPLYTPVELHHLLKDSGAKAIVVLENFAHVVEKALPGTQVKKVILTQIGDLFPWGKRHLVNFVVKNIKKMVSPYHLENKIDFLDVLSPSNGLAYQAVTLAPQDLAFLQYTGGTTGNAKGAMLSHRNMVSNVMQATEWISPIQLDTLTGGIITALPLYHIFSLTANCLTFIKLGVCNILITNPRDIPGFIKELKRQPFCAITGVNTLFNALLRHPHFKQVDFQYLKLALGGGMAVQKAVADKWKMVTQTPLIEAYGLTEASPAVCINPMDLQDYNGAIGLPIPSTEIKICDPDGQECPLGEVGELYVKGPQVMQGYWHQEEKTRQVLTQEGWLKTGDVAQVDPNGFVKIVDRIKDIIIVSGFNVYPNEIEDTIAAIDGVIEVAVVGVPSEEMGEKVKAFVVAQNTRLTPEHIQAHCRKFLTNYKIPKEIEFRKELPKTNVGKVLRRALREETKQVVNG